MNLVGPIYAEKLVKSGCLYVFIIEFPASLLPMDVPSHKSESPNPQINSVQCIVNLCFEQAQPKMCHSPKVDDGVDIFFKTS